MADAPSEEAEEQPRMTIAQKWVIKCCDNRRSKFWVANTKDDSHGRPYIKLSKFDRSFVYFCLGKGMDLESQRSANVQGFDALMQRRKAASVQAVHRALETENSQGKKRKVRDEDKELVDDHVTIELDELTTNDGRVCGGFGARVLWGLDSSTLWLELTEANMEFMRVMVRAGQSDRGKTKSKNTAAKGKPKPSPKRSRLRRLALLASSPHTPRPQGPPSSYPVVETVAEPGQTGGSTPLPTLPDTMEYTDQPTRSADLAIDLSRESPGHDAQPRSPYSDAQTLQDS